MGRYPSCDDCRKAFSRTKDGVLRAIYSTQKSKSKKRGYTPPNYSVEEFIQWSMARPEFHALHQAWEASGYVPDLRPSFDRLDDYISYRLDNLQVTTWRENNAKGKRSQLDGSNNKKSVAVDMLADDGTFVQRYHSVSEAARQFNGAASHIIAAITSRVSTRRRNGKVSTYSISTAYGHKWRYSTAPNVNMEKTP